MSREQAADYEEKKKAILDAAAGLFARVGYPNAQLKEVAKACGASKSMLYHYFPSKDDVLYALLHEHLQSTIDAIEQIDPARSPEERFRLLIEIYIQKSTQTRTRHVVAMNDVKYLSGAPLKKILELERRVMRLFEAALAALDPELPGKLVAPYSMMLTGMLSWIDLWYRPNGPLKQDELVERVAQLFLHGYFAAKKLA
jgi:AcrR family transcriptional regulator